MINTFNAPSNFLRPEQGGLNDANRILGDYHRQSIAEANKTQEIEKDKEEEFASDSIHLAEDTGVGNGK